MHADELFRQVTIPVPCPMDWDRMHGDDRVRHCETCGKNVHDIARISSDDAVALIHDSEGASCGRLTILADGTVLTSDGQPQIQQPSRRWQFRIRTVMAVIAGVAATLGFARLFPAREDLPIPLPTGVNLRSQMIVMGKMVRRRDLMPAPQNPPSQQSP